MPQSLLANIISHWHKPFGDFQASSDEFYRSVESGLDRRQLPRISVSRVKWHEGGVLSARREYLRVARQKVAFDCCAAPFGTGFFFSWWLGEKRPSRVVCWLLLLLFAALAFFLWRLCFTHLVIPRELARRVPPFLISWLLVIAIAALVFFLYLLTTKAADMDWDDPIIAVPILGFVYEKFLRPETYYQTDTILMFQSAVHSAVCEAIDALTTARGLRALTDEEKKPILRDFLRR